MLKLTKPVPRRIGSSHKARGDGGFSLVEVMMVLVMASVLSAMAIPFFNSIMRNLRADGDMRSLGGDVTLAKMRAAATFSKARLRADLTAGTFQVELWDKTASTWSIEGGTQSLSKGVSFGFGAIATAPPNTQASIGQAAACQTSAETVANTAGTVANSACVIFSSRGIPVDHVGVPTTADALYVSDGSSVQGVTVGPTGIIRTWRTDTAATNWKKR
jgi:prepilin-type N-terminal cleavage/methylation domain-containing protein